MNLDRANSGGFIIGCVVASGMIGFSIAAAGGHPALIIGGAAVIGAVGLIAAGCHGVFCSGQNKLSRRDQKSHVIVVDPSIKFGALAPRVHNRMRGCKNVTQVIKE